MRNLFAQYREEYQKIILRKNKMQQSFLGSRFFYYGKFFIPVLRFIGRIALKPFCFARWLIKWLGIMILSWVVGIAVFVIFISFGAMYFFGEHSEIFLQDPEDCRHRGILQINTRNIDGMLYQQDTFPLPNIFADEIPSSNWVDLRHQLNRAVQDENIKGVLVKYQGLESGRTGVEELAMLLDNFKEKSGKKVWIFGHNYGGYHGLADYVVASRGDEILLSPSGFVQFNLLVSERFYLQRFFQHWGIQTDFTRRHEYKSAVSTYTKTAPSAKEISNLEDLLKNIDGRYQEIIAPYFPTMAKSLERKIISANDSLKDKIIDELVYEDELLSYLQQSFSDMIDLIPVSCYTPLKKPSLTAKKVQVMNLVGTILPVMQDNFWGQDLLQQIKTASQNDDIAALLVYVTSPGGDYAMSERIWHALYQVDKPVVVLMGDVAASGGYFVASAADKIFGYPSSITGSIGIFSGHFATRKFITDILHIDPYLISSAPQASSDFLDRYHASYRQQIERFIDVLYADFTGKINLKRGFSAQKLDEIARGRVFSGAQAQHNGLIDGSGGLSESLEWLEKALHAPIELVPQKQEQDWDDLLFATVGTSLEERIKVRVKNYLYHMGIGSAMRMQLPYEFTNP